MNKCNGDCLKCKFSDCINNEAPTLEEYEFSRCIDKDILKSRPRDFGVGSRHNRKPYDIKYYETHREEQLQRCKQYRENNPEKRKETLQNYRDNNRETLREKGRKYYHDNLEEQRLKKRLYYQQNKDEINRKRRERKRLKNESSKEQQAVLI